MSRANVVFGAVGLVIFMVLGFVLQMNIEAKESFLNDVMQPMWRASHVHGMGLAILSIIYGLVTGAGRLSGKVIRTGGILAVVGALCIPLALFLAGINPDWIAPLAPIGTVATIVAWGIMAGVLVAGRGRF